MSEIKINKCVYSVHPIYDLYASDENGNVINIIKKVPNKGDKKYNGYMCCSIRKYGGEQKRYQVHRFVWECFNGIIPEGKVIDPINNDKEDNRLCSLQLITQQQNCKKLAKHRDCTFTANNCKNRKCVKAINKNTNEVLYFNSLYSVNQNLGINAGIVKMVCEGLNNCKSGISKKDGHSYTFQYINQYELPNNYKKTSNIRPRRVSDEEKKKHQMEAVKKWQNKEYQCRKCNETIKNGNKFYHKKRYLNSQKQ